MSRHRDVRCMNYSEEYENYDEVYGHSVEDDYCVSPSAEQFLFDRSKQQNIASFITEPDILEDNEDNRESLSPSKEEERVLTELERAKLISCMESIKNIIGDTVPETEIKKKIIQSNFDAEVALDLVLKESPPKTVIEPSTGHKDNLELYSDATPIKLQSTSFVIPKFSFNKQNNIQNSNMNSCFARNIESLRTLSVSNPPIISSSLPGCIPNHIDSVTSNSTNDPCKNNLDAVSFKSLADLTAHHLQKSTNLIGSTNFNGEASLCSTNFVIPKLSIKNDKSNDLENVQLNSFDSKKNINLESIYDQEKDDSMDSLERSISNVLALQGIILIRILKNKSQNMELEENSTNVSGTRTPSPDPWIIDLSSALKEATSLVVDTCTDKNSKALKDVSNVIPNSRLQTSNENTDIPYAMLPTTLNLSSLKYAKLPYTKRNVSLFGRTLCRIWKMKKPLLKSQSKQHQTIQKFDFSIPYM